MPNLNFDMMQLDFGCIMNNSRETKYINILNKSPMSLNFKWKMFALEQSRISKKLLSHTSNRRNSDDNLTNSENLQGKLVPLNSPIAWKDTLNEIIQEVTITFPTILVLSI